MQHLYRDQSIGIAEILQSNMKERHAKIRAYIYRKIQPDNIINIHFCENK